VFFFDLVTYFWRHVFECLAKVSIDGLLVRLKQSKIGCWIGNTFVGALAYADDITLLAPTQSGMRYMLRICEEYGREFCVSFNAAKSASMYCGKKTCSLS